MINFKKHRPAYMEGDILEFEQYDSFEELMNSEYIQRWAADRNFSYFAKSDTHIMCILKEGFVWWVIGHIKPGESDLIELPEWTGGRYKAILEDGTEIVLERHEVQSSCGGELTLTDGRKVKRVRS
jgi:hypothetical protein